MKQKQRRGNSAEGIAQFVAEHRQELIFRAVGLRKTIGVGLQGLLDADKFARGHANHLVDVLDDHSAVARIEEMVRLNGLGEKEANEAAVRATASPWGRCGPRSGWACGSRSTAPTTSSSRR